MNRRNRTLLVLLVAVGLASLATYGVFRTIRNIPVREVEVAKEGELLERCRHERDVRVARPCRRLVARL